MSFDYNSCFNPSSQCSIAKQITEYGPFGIMAPIVDGNCRSMHAIDIDFSLNPKFCAWIKLALMSFCWMLEEVLNPLLTELSGGK